MRFYPGFYFLNILCLNIIFPGNIWYLHSNILSHSLAVKTSVLSVSLFRGLGYLRVVLTLAAFFFILSQPYVTAALYLTSGDVLDAVDGFTARYFNQCKKQHSVLLGMHLYPDSE